MGINIESNIKELPNDLLRTKISWAAHDLDKTINAYANKTQFFLIAKNESKKLEECLNEWAIRKLEEEDLILWARNVQIEYLSVVNKGTEINYINYDFSNLNPDSLYEIIKTRRSVRRWKEDPVPPDLIKKIIEAAQWAPSACNRQSCRFIILEDKHQKKVLTSLREDWLKFAPLIIFVGCDKRNERMSVHSHRFHDAANEQKLSRANTCQCHGGASSTCFIEAACTSSRTGTFQTVD